MHADPDPELSDTERRLAAHLRRQLDVPEPADPARDRRLDAARRRALNALPAATVPVRGFRPAWAAGALAAASLVVAVVLVGRSPPGQVTDPLQADALEWMVLTEEQAGLVEELDFYEWLQAELRDA